MGIIIAVLGGIAALALGAGWLGRRWSRAARADAQRRREEIELAERKLAERTGRMPPGDPA